MQSHKKKIYNGRKSHVEHNLVPCLHRDMKHGKRIKIYNLIAQSENPLSSDK